MFIGFTLWSKNMAIENQYVKLFEQVFFHIAGVIITHHLWTLGWMCKYGARRMLWNTMLKALIQGVGSATSHRQVVVQ